MTTFASDGSTKLATPSEPELVTEPDPQLDLDEPETAGTDLAVNTTSDVAVAEKWDHDFLEFKGDKIGIRVPTSQAMSGLAMGLGKFVPTRVQNDISGLFIARHLSPDSYSHVYSRLMDPDDPDYKADTIGELVGAILNTGAERLKEQAEAEKKLAAKNGKKPK